MRRYWVPDEYLQGEQIVLQDETLHHIRDVCRQSRGSKFEVLLSGGRAFLVEIVAESKQQSTARILEKRQIPPLPKPHIHLVLAISRFPVMEAVLEKMVEMGVSSVHPVFSEFSFLRKQEDVLQKKRGRWEKIIVSATQQCGRGDLMTLAEAVPLKEIASTINQNSGAQGLFLYEGPGGLPVQEALRSLQEAQPQDIWLFIGSEGGYSEAEVQFFQNQGWPALTLGGQVLRVETACVAAVSVIKYDFGLMV